ncbi:dTMP kinase [Candidatus Acetothermia bacterium]|nr:dTMP kinase [Candidatus Acetothermia bacterium]MCI2425839.1 dTMP kinase [Candidatus Acetothermia bacterium]MCI2427387.1 dTMP kinase [Candidatus Acetothermia bacterium]MCI2428774.1 dTMP kinase [Candidatus Acetothermia bacterium]
MACRLTTQQGGKIKDLTGKFIVFEGLDATGKSTQVKHLAKLLQRRGLTVVTTREPGGTPLGEAIRRILLDNENHLLTPLSELLLFVASRHQLTKEVIQPALQAGKTVISSRYTMSSLVYQGYGRGIDLDLIQQLNAVATTGLQPDFLFLIDVTLAVAINRMIRLSKHGERRDRIETEDIAFYERVQRGYREAASKERGVYIIDGELPEMRIAEQVAAHLDFC